MARETDFLELYKLLDLRPDCAPLELKQAYRRRVAALHPDRESQRATVSEDAAQLQYLTALYGAAMDFQRRHHRLPGAAGGAARPGAHRAPERRVEVARTKRSSGHWWPVALLLVAAVAVVWTLQPSPPNVATHFPDASSSIEAAAQTPLGPSALALDMDPHAVQLLQGAPILISGDRWEYGPSWILFEKQKVVDWYSSPLQPLRTAVTRPPARLNPTAYRNGASRNPLKEP